MWLQGGMHGCQGGACIGFDEIQSMNGWYAFYWNAFLLKSVNIRKTVSNYVYAYEM